MAEAIAATPQERTALGFLRPLTGVNRSAAATVRLVAAIVALLLLIVATIVFVAARLDRPNSPFADGLVAVAGSQGGLELIDPTGTVVDRLDTQKVAGAAWSPDGRALAYWNGLGGSWTIDILDAGTGETRTLTDGAGIDTLGPRSAPCRPGSPRALPAGPTNGLVSGRHSAAGDVADGPVVVVDVESGVIRRLNEDDAIGGAASWSPDGRAWRGTPRQAGTTNISCPIQTVADGTTVTIDPELPDATGYWGTFARPGLGAAAGRSGWRRRDLPGRR